MSLKTWVDDECTSSGVHGSNELGILDVHKRQLVLVIPMLVVSVLSEKSNGGLSIIWIWARHVEIINEIEKLLGSSWCVKLTSFLLKLLLQDELEKIGICVEVHVDNLLNELAVCTSS